MNYVGQLAGQVFVQVKELYRGLNPATLSGCIDIIVVRQPDSSLQCSPFHVRFGKMGVLRSREKVVDIEVNGEPVNLHMKLGENGEAFFVTQTENDQVRLNPHQHTDRVYASSSEEINSAPNVSRPCSPKSDSELVTKAGEEKQQNPAMLWAWGELPQVLTSHIHIGPETNVASSALTSGQTRLCRISRPSFPCYYRYLYSIDPIYTPIYVQLCVRRVLVNYAAVLLMSALCSTDKRSRHLGSDGVYLDDITELDPEVAALYFPKSESSGAGRVCCENTVRSVSMSPQSVGSSGADSGVDSYSEQTTDLPSIALSLCGGLTDSREITKEHFQEKAVSYSQFAANPALIDDPNLVVKIGSKYYNWSTAAPIMLSMQVFQMPLPKATIESIVKEKMPRKGGRWWFSWRGRGSSSKTVRKRRGSQFLSLSDSLVPSCGCRRKDESSSSDEDHLSTKQTTSSSTQSESLLSQGGVSYRKTLRLTSEQLASLQLKEGPNDVVFSVTTQYQGTCRCEGTIYLWNWDDKIIISDIDGTITRSDTLGHILPTLGKDWTHQGIARLFHKVSQNGYKFMYCSARAIGMAGMTRGYLHWVNESGTMLPQGPVLLSPSSLFSALHREVIEKKPEKFKVECLTDIKNLFSPNTQPFYAAFGNRATDVYSYKEVGVPLNRIFTVNPKGELVQEHAKTNVSSYVRLGEVVDHVFPLLRRSSSSDFPCSDTYSHFNFWREQLPLVDSQECAGKISS
uniref:phosphatidate phosphatase n=1 Tax=Pygocentrus nattereri TaxID=42514 RepID=A0AAR2JYR7_PYGNA